MKWPRTHRPRRCCNACGRIMSPTAAVGAVIRLTPTDGSGTRARRCGWRTWSRANDGRNYCGEAGADEFAVPSRQRNAVVRRNSPGRGSRPTTLFQSLTISGRSRRDGTHLAKERLRTVAEVGRTTRGSASCNVLVPGGEVLRLRDEHGLGHGAASACLLVALTRTRNGCVVRATGDDVPGCTSDAPVFYLSAGAWNVAPTLTRVPGCP